MRDLPMFQNFCSKDMKDMHERQLTYCLHMIQRGNKVHYMNRLGHRQRLGTSNVVRDAQYWTVKMTMRLGQECILELRKNSANLSV